VRSIGCRRYLLVAAALSAVAILVAIVIFASAPYNHDEEQYVAAAALARNSTPYLDFIYLQAPVYPILVSKVFEIFPSFLYSDARFVSVVIFLLSCTAAFIICARTSKSRWAPVVGTLFFCMSPTIQASAGTARNDMLPCGFLLFGVMSATIAITPPPSDGRTLRGFGLWFLCGATLALAAGTKISYTFAPVMAFLYLISFRRFAPLHPAGLALIAFCAGSVVGELPVVYYLCIAPHNFIFDNIWYHRLMPSDWYERNHLDKLLSPSHRLIFAAEAALKELPVLASVAFIAWATVSLIAVHGWREAIRQFGNSPRGLLAFMLAGAIPLSLAPNPPQPQYMVPIFTTLILLGASCVPCLGARSPARHAIVGLITVFGIVVGAWRSAAQTSLVARFASWIPERMEEEAAAIKGARTIGGLGCIATLAPIRVLDAGGMIYPELASGPFFFRSGNLLKPKQVGQLRGVSPATISAFLDRHPPAGVLVGYEDYWRVDLDSSLIAFATARHYREASLRLGKGRLFLNPNPSAPC
jgi:hypothetical protein